ncbi:MAG: alpha/beta hydrolase [Burkholderiales bacterium]|nr:alpha/beta hydrolase [Anaerolineae bacterium]
MKSLYLTVWQSFIRYYEVSGEGTTLVYLAGLGIPSLINFLPVLTHVDMGMHHSILVDYLGCGLSDHPAGFDYSIENHALAVAAVLDHENIKDCTIIGHSMGGTVGIMLAILRPDLVAKLIVAEANISPGGGSLSRQVASHSEAEWVNAAHHALLDGLRTAAIGGNSFAALASGTWRTVDPVGFYRGAAAMVQLEPALKEQFLKLSIPRTFVYGENSLPENTGGVQPDAPDPKELERHGINIAVVANAGHGMIFENLQGFVDVLKTAMMKAEGSQG